MNVGRRTLYKHLYNYGFLKNWERTIHNFSKPISQSEFNLLSNKNKKKYNRFAMANNFQPYERKKNSNN